MGHTHAGIDRSDLASQSDREEKPNCRLLLSDARFSCDDFTSFSSDSHKTREERSIRVAAAAAAAPVCI